MTKQYDVEAWLRANEAADYLPAFQKEQFTDLRDIDEATIKRIVTPVGLQKRLIRDATERKQGYETPEIPKLEKGATLDLSDPKLPDGTAIRIPSVLSNPEHANALPSPFDLDTSTEWPIIAKERNLLTGFVMHEDEAALAESPVLVWKIPMDSEFVQDYCQRSEVISTTTYTERDNSLVKSGFTKAAISAKYMFAAVSAEVTVGTKSKHADKTSKLYVVSTWRYPRARLFLEYCSAVSPKFVAAVERAFSENGEGYRAYKALQQVFHRFGHVVPWKFVVGSELFLEHIEQKTATTDESSIETDVRAALTIKTAGFGGSASGEHAEGLAESHKALEIASKESIRANGGDTLLASAPDKWIPTVAKPLLWSTISIEETKATVDLLPDPLRDRVLALWDKYRDHDTEGYPQPTLDGKVYSIQALANLLTPDKTMLVEHRTPGTTPITLPLYPRIAKDAQHLRLLDLVKSIQPRYRDHLESNLKPRVPGVEPHKDSHLIRSEHDQPDALVLPSKSFPGVTLTGVAGLHLTKRWHITFSGERDASDHAPLYWIEYELNHLLLGWDNRFAGPDVLPPVLLVDPIAKKDPTGDGSGALWRIDQVDPSHGDAYAHAYTIRHAMTGRTLHLMEVYREALGDDTRLLGGGPCLYARFTRFGASTDTKRIEFDNACWVLTPLAN